MEKQKSDERNYRKIFLKMIVMILIIIGGALILPNIYLAITYYDLPEDSLPLTHSDFAVNTDKLDDLCIHTRLYPNFTPSTLRVRMVVDAKIAPLNSIHITHRNGSHENHSPTADYVCTDYFSLAEGVHTIQVYINNQYQFYAMEKDFYIDAEGHFDVQMMGGLTLTMQGFRIGSLSRNN